MSYFDRMLRRPFAVASAAALLIGSLSACVSVETPTSSVAPKSEETNQRQRSVWDAYLSSYNKVLSNPGAGIEDLKPYVSDAHLSSLERTVKQLAKAQVRVEGTVRTKNFIPQTDREDRFTALVCLDNTHSSVRDRSDKDVTPSSRARFFTVRAVIIRLHGKFVVDQDEQWSKSSAC